ncbi:helix-turn-helix domain-containing protein [Microlunatus sp. Y2014]|uniref:helix-turn-helix domain-containing protein n=1 Tax=Microlunatus sp. Y2014 TaxID=3418488 RepID=UPI003DA7258D
MARAMKNQMLVAGGDASAVLLEPLLVDVVCRVRRAGWYELDGTWVLPERVTPAYVLFMINFGTAEFTEADRRFTLGPGQTLLTSPHVVQSGRARSTELALSVVHFTAHSRGLPDAPPLAGLPSVITSSGPRHRRIARLGRRIADELSRGATGDRDLTPAMLAANGTCSQLVAELWRTAVAQGWQPAEEPARAEADLARLRPALELIGERYAEPLTVAELAAVVHLHPTYFAQLFRRTIGLSPGRYLSHVRLAHARELLLGTGLGIDQVAMRTGHGSASYLSRVFRAAEGVPPGTYRRTGERLQP